MTKPVPDPPLTTQTSTTFGSCNGSHDPLFAVRPGVSSEDALIHASVLLKSAYQTNAHACDMVNAEVRGLLWATEQSLEMSLALVEALLDEVEARSATAAVLRRTVQAGQSAAE
ncbi:DUF6124 family protein [Pseudomonas sp. GZD-222]|uniref:DUF6124 family protein n=1 Tax=Pseudomonas sp. GZD-222 TaxID=3404805 RepID=UPI003BB5FDAF